MTVQRQLPPPPSWAVPVGVAEPKAGDDALTVAARERAGRVQANRRIGDFGAWYGLVRQKYAGETHE